MSAKKSASNVRLQDIEEFRAKLKSLHLEYSTNSATSNKWRDAPSWWLSRWERQKGIGYVGPKRVRADWTQEGALSSNSISCWDKSMKVWAIGWCADPKKEMIQFYTDGEDRPIGMANHQQSKC